MNFWIVFCYDEVEDRNHIYYVGERAVAKSIARHMNKISSKLKHYWAESEPWRWT